MKSYGRDIYHLFLTQTAFSSVLANFIFGLAVGALSFSQIAKRMNPLRLYSICEAGIGLWSLVFPIFIRGVDYLIQKRISFIDKNQLLRHFLSLLTYGWNPTNFIITLYKNKICRISLRI